MGVIDLVIDPKWKPSEESIWNSLLEDYQRKPAMGLAWAIFLHCQFHAHRTIPENVFLKIHDYMTTTAIREANNYRETNPRTSQDRFIEQLWVKDVDLRMKEYGQTQTEALQWWREYFSTHPGFPLSKEDEPVQFETIRKAYQRAKGK